MKNLTFLTYNNYFNRIIKREEDLASYLSYTHKTFQNLNFNHNDEINTSIIVNWNESWQPDYCVEFDESDIIKSRWFVVLTVRTRGGQYRVTLKRDVIGDYYDQVLQAPCFIERATLLSSDPLIYNKEGIAFNQIKTKEKLLVDNSKMSWVALYLAQGTTSDSSKLRGNIALNTPSDLDYINVNSTLENWEFYPYITNGYKRVYDKQYIIQYRTKINIAQIIPEYKRVYVNQNGLLVETLEVISETNLKVKLFGSVKVPKLIAGYIYDDKTNINAAANSLLDETKTFDNFKSLNNRIYKFSDNRYLRMKVTPLNSRGKNIDIVDEGSTATLFNLLKSSFLEDGEFKDDNFSGTFNNHTFKIAYMEQAYTLTYEEITSNIATQYDLSGTKNLVKDAPYEVIFLPYSSSLSEPIYILGQHGYGDIRFDACKNIVNDIISRGVAGQWLYDAQVIPYCPFKMSVVYNSVEHKNILTNLGQAKSHKTLLYTPEGSSNEIPFGIALYLDSISYTNNIAGETFDSFSNDPAINIKAMNETVTCRLTSPNFNGQFEFSPAKNGGTVDYFNIDVTLFPYQPYIHVNPDFKNLYGFDYNDPRGLVCGGNFSLSQWTDAWKNYVTQNKNFNEIFDRQIQNMDTIRNYQKIGEVAGAIAGTAQGTAMGGVSGGVASGIGGLADLALSEASYRESRSYTTEMHNYQLANIQALPQSLTKVTSINNNNKIFPILEVYTATDKEVKALISHLQYDGMNVGMIGTIANYQKEDRTFIKGQIIRLDNIQEDSQVFNDIYNEISKGVYI